MTLNITELAQLKTKAERRPFCEKYGLSHKQLKRIVDDYNQGKYTVENGYIEVALRPVRPGTPQCTSDSLQAGTVSKKGSPGFVPGRMALRGPERYIPPEHR